MYDEKTIRKLKQNNIALDSEKVKERISSLWKQADKSTREEIMKLSTMSKFTVARTYKTGSISAKMVVAFSQVCNVNPNYLTGAANEPDVCTDKLLKDFLTGLGYSWLRSKRTDKNNESVQDNPSDKQPILLVKKNGTSTPISLPKKKETKQDVVECMTVAKNEYLHDEKETAACECEPANANSILSMSDDDVMLLIRSLKLKAGIGVSSAMSAVKELDNILLT